MSTIDCVCIYVHTFKHFALIYTMNLFVCVNKEFCIFIFISSHNFKGF